MKGSYVSTILTLIFFSGKLFALDFNLSTLSNLEDTQNKIISNYIDPEAVDQIGTFVEKAVEAQKKAPDFLREDTVNSRNCSHCPRHMELASSVNKIVEAMKKNPELKKNDDIPIEINRLRFMFYQVKSRMEDGNVRCKRYQDMTPDLKPTSLDGNMELMAEDVFSFNGIAGAQLIDPNKEEITYFYRGEGDQRNILVQAILTKDGGKFRYYYYRPTEKEKNPFGLPSMGEDENDATLKKATLNEPQMKMTEQDKIDSKNKYKLSVSPELETKMSVIPKNLRIAKGMISQSLFGTGLRLNADSGFSLKGNEAQANIQSEEGKKVVELDVVTALTGVTTAKLVVPYEIRLNAEDKPDVVKLNGKLEEHTNQQVVTLALTSKEVEQVKVEWKRPKDTLVPTYEVSRGFDIRQGEKLTMAVGRNEQKNKYYSFQAQKSIKDNLTMVLEVRKDIDNRNLTLTYQMKAKF